MSSEKAALVAALDSQRRHVLGILDGLSEEDLRRAVLPSGWSCLALVQHLALDVEQFWFRRVVAGEPAAAEDPVTEDAWVLDPATSAADVLALYRREVELANGVVAATSLDSPPAWWPDFFGDFRMDDLRQVLLHVLTETACHTGHLDAARELLDGRQWVVLTG